MNCIIILFTVLSLVTAAVINEEAKAKIVHYENTNDGSGNYQFSYETSNGITREERGYLINSGSEDEHILVEGSFSYTDPNGNLVVVRYQADENGYQVNPIPISTNRIQPNVVATLLGK